MGDVGEYWREHNEYQRRREGAERLGMTGREAVELMLLASREPA